MLGARSLLLNGLMQTNLDASGFQILNLDTSNLVFPGIPTQAAPPSNWYNSYDAGSMLFGFGQPAFANIAGNLTSLQQSAITRVASAGSISGPDLGTGGVTVGTWRADPLLPDKVPALNLINPPTSNVNLSSHRIVNLADPIDPQDAATLNMLRQLAGQNPKQAVKCATTAAISEVGHQTIDGIAVTDGDRVLVKNQPNIPDNRFQNGIWIVAAGVWMRAPDFDSQTDVVGASVFVLGGTANANTRWFQTTPAPITINVTPLVFVLIDVEAGGGSSISAGPGLQLVSTVMSAVGTANRIHIGTGIDIDAAYVGQGSITTLGTIATGIWHGTIIDPQHGGTGLANAYTVSLAGNLATTLLAGAPTGSSLTFALNGPSTLALPLSGTLATLAGNETFTNKHISMSQVDTGVLRVSQGGTGVTTLLAAITAMLPSQAGMAGKKLTTDGTGILTWT